MIPCRPARFRTCRVVALAVVCVAPLVFTAAAQAQAPSNRGGGLLPTREKPTISGGQTRDEMLRKFDLDSDGRIDEAEAEAARARMRRDKIDSLQNSGLDPLTGRPRQSSAAAKAAAEPPIGNDELMFPRGNAPDAPRPKPAGEAERKPAAKPAPALPAGRLPVITGGVRAGAPAVRPGYGATGPKQEINAGRPRAPQLTPGQARVGAAMQPAGRPPQQFGSPRAATPRPTAEK